MQAKGNVHMHAKIQLIRRWMNIALGKSAVAVEQGVGKCYSRDRIRGYYNDLTGKVSPATLLDDEGIPVNITSSGARVYSLVTIMQYALGCFDLYLMEDDAKYKDTFLRLSDFILRNQEDGGKWDARASIGSSQDNSSCMAQGQGCSIMLRAHGLTGDLRYLQAAERAVAFMLLPCDQGGTAVYTGEDITLEKYPPQGGRASSVLNGWIFALFGLYDYLLATGSAVQYRRLWEQSCRTLESHLSQYDRAYWSDYDLLGTIASPAYHSVHIALLKALADLSGSKVMFAYAERFERYRRSRVRRLRAVAVKLAQKLTRPSDSFFVQ